jgi:hypothetical protein
VLLRRWGRLDRAEGRKVFVSAELTEEAGKLLTETNGLMVRRSPGSRDICQHVGCD